ncbi:hypothetical protein [Rhodomicrobium lacus]|uniref:hypothetical protein n=1 Tax=Rhodomicrobium lacus TaxID=2498452 RepID=UPI000F8D46AD|nr:hypothetical protein [Rhodomicrobium lacus]
MGSASRNRVAESKYIAVFNGVAPADQTAVEVDRIQNGVIYRAMDIVFAVNAENASDTLSNALKLELILQHSDASGSGQAAVTADDLVGDIEATVSSGIVKAIDSPAEAAGIYKIGYVGNKRYVTIDLEATGTFTGGVPLSSVFVRLSDPSLSPVS